MSNELYHHGILGQKWGVRRYQNPDGSLTPAGRAKLGYSPEPRKKGLFSRKKKPKAKKEAAQPKPQKSVNEMTLNELMDKKARLSLERDVLDLQTQIRSKNAQLNPTKKNAVKELAKEFATDTLKPAAKEASKKLLSKTIDDLLGTGDSQSLKAMEREILELQKKKTLRDLKNDMNEESSTNRLLEMEREISRLQKEKSLRDLRKDLNKTDEERAYEDLKKAADRLKIEAEIEKSQRTIRNKGSDKDPDEGLDKEVVKKAFDRMSPDDVKDFLFKAYGISGNSAEPVYYPLNGFDLGEQANIYAILQSRGLLHSAIGDFRSGGELYHHGILGQKWGVRRYQNEDGSLTEAGRKRYLNSDGSINDKRISRQERSAARLQKKIDRVAKKADKAELKRGKYAKRFFRTDASDEKFDRWSRKYAKLDAKELKLQKKFDKKYDGVDKLRDASDRASKEAIRVNETNEELNRIKNEYDKASANAKWLINDYRKDAEKYACIAGAAQALIDSPNANIEQVAEHMQFYAWDDGDQGPGNSFQVYLDSTGRVNDAREYNDQLNKIHQQYSEASSRAKANGIKADKLSWGAEYSLGSGVSDRYSQSKNKKYAQAVANAKKIVARIDFGKGGTWMIDKAIRNAGLSNVKWSDMTDAQWLKLNAELKKLPRGPFSPMY